MKPLLLPLLLLGFAVGSSAQPADGQVEEAALPTDDAVVAFLEDPDTTADQAYRLGVQMFEAGRYQSAEQAWLRAYALGQDAKLLVAVADARQRRDDVPGAVAMLERYLEERPQAPDRISVETRIATLRRSPARLIIQSEDHGHAILLDGTPTGDETPATLQVEPGTHTVMVVADGRRVGEQTVRVAYGEVRTLEFTSETSREAIGDQEDEAELRAELAKQREDRTIRRAVIATGSISAAALATGTVLGLVALRNERSYEDEPTARGADQGERMALFADVSFGLAALSAITAFTLFMTHKNKRSTERATARLEIETRGTGATATLRF